MLKKKKEGVVYRCSTIDIIFTSFIKKDPRGGYKNFPKFYGRTTKNSKQNKLL